jgi:hypothetical protein
MLDADVQGHKLKLDQSQLETVIPAIGGKVCIFFSFLSTLLSLMSLPADADREWRIPRRASDSTCIGYCQLLSSGTWQMQAFFLAFTYVM